MGGNKGTGGEGNGRAAKREALYAPITFQPLHRATHVHLAFELHPPDTLGPMLKPWIDLIIIGPRKY
jgi:hypothetical protein